MFVEWKFVVLGVEHNFLVWWMPFYSSKMICNEGFLF